MKQHWSTQEQDMTTAKELIEAYAIANQSDSVDLFELVVDKEKKQMGFCLSGWVLMLAQHFTKTYGPNQGDFVTRQVLSRCITQGNTVH
jgi:hypothetical protein